MVWRVCVCVEDQFMLDLRERGVYYGCCVWAWCVCVWLQTINFKLFSGIARNVTRVPENRFLSPIYVHTSHVLPIKMANGQSVARDPQRTSSKAYIYIIHLYASSVHRVCVCIHAPTRMIVMFFWGQVEAKNLKNICQGIIVCYTNFEPTKANWLSEKI